MDFYIIMYTEIINTYTNIIVCSKSLAEALVYSVHVPIMVQYNQLLPGIALYAA